MNNQHQPAESVKPFSFLVFFSTLAVGFVFSFFFSPHFSLAQSQEGQNQKEVEKARAGIEKGIFSSKMDAIQSLTQILKSDPKNTEALRLRGIAYTQNFQLKEGQKDFENLAREDKRWISYYDLGYNLLLQNRLDESLQVLNTAQKVGPENFMIYSLRAEVYRTKKQTAQAEKDYAQALKINPEAHSVYAQRSTYFYQFDRLQSALKDIDQALYLNKKVGYYYYLKAFILGKMNKWQQAKEEIDKAIAVKGKYGLFYWARGICFEALGFKDKALQEYTLAIQYGFEVQSYVARGVLNYKQGNIELAEEDLKQAIAVQTNNPMAYLYLGKINYINKNIPLAESQFAQALRFNKLDPELYYSLGNFYASVEEHKKAISQYTQAIVRNASSPLYFYKRALSSYHLKQYNQSLSDVEKALSVHSSNQVFQDLKQKNKTALLNNKK